MQLISSDQLLWLVCAVFYLSDTVKLPSLRRMIVTGEVGASWSPSIPLYRFLILGRALTILNPFTPWRMTLVLSWLGHGDTSAKELRGARRRLRVWEGRLGGIRIVACAMFVGLFVLGPIATELRGLFAGLLLVAPIYVIAWLVLLITLLSNRLRLGIHWGQLIWRLVECAICPGYLANIWRRLLIEHFDSRADAMLFCALDMRPSQLRQMRREVNAYVDDLRERETITDQDQAALTLYRSIKPAPSIFRQNG